MLSLARVEREVAAAANRLAAMDLGEGGESLTQTASNRRAAREELARRTKATANDENDEKLHASREAIDAYARAAEGAKRNAVRLAAVLEREVAMGNAGRSRDILEQRVSAANAAAAALQNSLVDNRVGDQGARALAQAMEAGALKHCSTLTLRQNRIGDPGVIAIAAALGAGAGKKLYTLRLDSNRWGDAGAIALAAAALNKALPVCEHLGLALNRISDRGVEVLTDVLARGALPACRWSWIRGNMARVELQEMYLSAFKGRRDEDKAGKAREDSLSEEKRQANQAEDGRLQLELLTTKATNAECDDECVANR
ncbi:hypothetical protein Ctob_016174, partial [Chrysochromulina tobinii]